MTDPKRLLDEGGDEAMLLRSAEADAPGAGLESRLLGALRSAPTPSVAASSGLLKGLAIATMAIVGVGATLVWLGSSGKERPTAGQMPAMTTRDASTPVAEPLNSASAPPPLAVEGPKDASAPYADADADADAAGRDRDAGAKPKLLQAAPRGDDLAAEMAALDACRRQLSTSDTSGALQCLGGYQARFPKGALSQEATVLRIEVLASAGRRDEARRVADAFLRAHPESAHRQRIQSLILDRPSDPR